jgi:hypothetical protein
VEDWTRFGIGNSETFDCGDEEMKFEEVIQALREGKRVFHLDSADLGLRFDIDEYKVKESFCLEVWDILADDWEVEE